MKDIIKKHLHIIDNFQVMQNKETMVAYKREKNLKELLTRTNPYNTINNVDDEMYRYVSCNKQCDSCASFVVAESSFECFATKRIYTKNAIYIAFCLNSLKQEVGSAVD